MKKDTKVEKNISVVNVLKTFILNMNCNDMRILVITDRI